MKVLVLGATGGTGKAAVQALLDGGHDVTAFSRHPDALELRGDRLHLQRGDATRAEDVARAVEGKDAVVVALGVNENPLKVRLRRSSTPVDVCSRGTAHALQAMKRFGVRKLVVVSAYGVGDTRERLPLPWKLAYDLLLKEQIADKEKQERLVRESGVDWVIVRPTALTNRRPRDEIFASPEGQARKSFVSRVNVGRFLAAATTGANWNRQAVALSG